MILVDTSVWIDHFRRSNTTLVALLERGDVATHPFVLGEIALGHLRNRIEVLGWLAEIPALPMASQEEVLGFVRRKRLFTRGVGWVDVHLLASALVARIPLWTTDKRLRVVAEDLGADFIAGTTA